MVDDHESHFIPPFDECEPSLSGSLASVDTGGCFVTQIGLTRSTNRETLDPRSLKSHLIRT
jgi:hypothetical protein